MRIVIATSYILDAPPDTSLQAMMHNLAAAYRDLGHDVVLAWSRSTDLPRLDQWLADVSVVRLGGKFCRSYIARVIWTFAGALAMLKGADFVQLYISPASLIDCALWLACKLRGVPTAGMIWGMGEGSRPREATVADRVFMALFLPRLRWTSTLSSFGADYVRASLPPVLSDNLAVIPNGIDARRMQNALLEAPEDAASRYVLCPALLRPCKGIDVLLMAWRGLCEEIEGVNLRLVGGDLFRDHYRRFADALRISHRVVFEGRVAREELWRLMRHSLFCVLPSRFEIFGLSILEAMALGKAVIATETGPRDYIEDGVSGLLVPPGSVERLRAAMSRLLHDEPLRQRLGRKALGVSHSHRWEDIAFKYIEMYNTPVGRRVVGN